MNIKEPLPVMQPVSYFSLKRIISIRGELVKFSYRPTGTNVGELAIYLERGNTYSEIVQLGPNATFSFMVEKD